MVRFLRGLGQPSSFFLLFCFLRQDFLSSNDSQCSPPNATQKRLGRACCSTSSRIKGQIKDGSLVNSLQRLAVSYANPPARKYTPWGGGAKHMGRCRIKTEKERGRERNRESAASRKPTAWLRVDFTRATYNLYAWGSLALQLPKYTEYVFAFRSLYRCVPVSVPPASVSVPCFSVSIAASPFPLASCAFSTLLTLLVCSIRPSRSSPFPCTFASSPGVSTLTRLYTGPADLLAYR